MTYYWSPIWKTTHTPHNLPGGNDPPLWTSTSGLVRAFLGTLGPFGTRQVEKEWGGADSDDSDDAATSIAKAGGLFGQ